MTTLTTIVPDPDPPVLLLETAPISAPPNGTQLVSTLGWNNLIALLQGTSVDEIDLDALEALTTNRALVTDAGGHIIISAVTDTELGFVSGVTSSIQTQLNGKEPSLGFTPENAANKGAVSGYAGLDASQLLLLANFPTGTGLQVLRRNSGNTALEFATLSDLQGITTLNSDTAAVQTLSGTANRITVVDSTPDHAFDIASTYVGQASITTLGTITTGVWNGTAITGANINAASTDLTDTADIAYLNTPNAWTSGLQDFSAVTLRIPVSTTPSVTVNGDIAYDSLVTDFSTGLIRFFGIEEQGIVTMPIIQFTTPSDGFVVSYNATNDEFELVAQSGGITSINSDTASAQTLTGGDGIDIVDSTPDHSFAVDATVARSTDNLSFFATTTSAQLLGVISDETGTGLLVFGTSPTIVTPTIVSFVNATHNHQSAAGGGTLLSTAALSDTASIAYLNTVNTFIAGNLNTFAHDATNPGLSVLPVAGNPSARADGAIWLNVSTQQMFARINGADVDLGAAGGGEIFTWTADHSMATFKLTAAAANDVILNAPTGQGVSIEVAAGQEYLFNATQADYFTNNIVNVGNLTLSKTGDTRVITLLRNEILADDTIIGQILFQSLDAGSVIEQYARIDGVMESDVVDDEDGSLHIHVAEAGVFSVRYMAFNDARSALIDILKPVNFNSQNLTNAVLITPTIAATGFTNMQHTHQAANTGSQLVATLALTATGTKDSTTFLRGDDTWAVPGGGGDMVLADVQTVTGAKTFGTIGGAVGKFILAGSTSGSTILNAAAIAGTTTITLQGVTGTVALLGNKLSDFAATTSAELITVISDETGSGLLVFGTSPTLITPALGTPSALVLTNATGLVNAGVDASAAIVATKLTGTAAQWDGAVSDDNIMFDGATNVVTGAIQITAGTMRIPLSATPTMAVDGDFAIDTTVTDFSHGVLKFFDGEEVGVVSMPIAEFTSPADGAVPTYNAANDEFKLVAAGGGATVTSKSDFNTSTDSTTSGTYTASSLSVTLSNVAGGIAHITCSLPVDASAGEANLSIDDDGTNVSGVTAGMNDTKFGSFHSSQVMATNGSVITIDMKINASNTLQLFGNSDANFRQAHIKVLEVS